MEIKKEPGKFFEGDEKIIIKTDGDEVFTFRDLFLVINIATINEVKRCRKKYAYDILDSGKRLFFEEAIKEAINLGKNDIDLTSKENEDKLKTFCEKHRINFKQMLETINGDFI